MHLLETGTQAHIIIEVVMFEHVPWASPNPAGLGLASFFGRGFSLPFGMLTFLGCPHGFQKVAGKFKAQHGSNIRPPSAVPRLVQSNAQQISELFPFNRGYTKTSAGECLIVCIFAIRSKHPSAKVRRFKFLRTAARTLSRLPVRRPKPGPTHNSLLYRKYRESFLSICPPSSVGRAQGP